jgi:hypothetical protein
MVGLRLRFATAQTCTAPARKLLRKEETDLA